MVKPYVRKEMVWSPRELEVLETAHSYVIRVTKSQTNYREATTTDPAQALAAIRECQKNDVGVLVYAVGRALGEEGIALVDDRWLMKKMEEKR